MQILFQLLAPILGFFPALLPAMLLTLPLATLTSNVFFLLKGDKIAFIWVSALNLCLGVLFVCAVSFAFIVGLSTKHGGFDGMSIILAAKSVIDTVIDGEKITRPVFSGVALWAYLCTLLSYSFLAATWFWYLVCRKSRR